MEISPTDSRGRGSKITMAGKRGRGMFSVALVRDHVQQKSVSFSWTDNNVLAIRFIGSLGKQLPSRIHHENLGPKLGDIF